MVSRERFNSYPESAKSLCVEASGSKECDGQQKEEGGISGGLGSSYKGRAPVPSFNLHKALESRPWDQRKNLSIRCDYHYSQRL